MILERYIATRYCSFLAMLFFGLTGLYLLIEAFERLPDFLDKGAGFLTILVYFSLICPKIIYELCPLTILLAGLLTIATMGKNREIMAMRSLGISPRRIFRPIMASALLFCTLFLLMNIYLVPRAEEAASLIVEIELGKNRKNGVMIQGGHLFYRGKDSILSAELVNPDAEELSGVQWLFFNPDYSLSEFIGAPVARYSNGRWYFFNGIEETGGNITFFKKIEKDLMVSPADLADIETPVEEAGFHVLIRAVKRLKRLGLPAYSQEMVLLGYIFYPLLGVTLLYLCLPVGLYRLQGGAALGLVLGTIVAFSVWALWNMLFSMGKTGTLPPAVSGLLPHAGLVTGGLWFRKRVRF